MKRFGMILACALVAMAAFAEGEKRWTNNIGVGLSVPFSHLDCDAYGKVNETAFALQGSYAGFARNGLTVKATLSLGGCVTNDFTLGTDTGWKGGLFADATLGFGYAIVRSQRFILTATALVGLSVSYYTQESETVQDPELGEVDRGHSAVFLAPSIGADVTAFWRIKNHFGLFVGAQFRWIPGGESVASTFDGDDHSLRFDVESDEIGNSFSIVPTLGVMWSF